MSNICKTVNLYTRKIKGGKMLSYFLDNYPGYRDETTNKVMRHESLGIYIYAHPKTQREKDYNARMSEKAEALRCRRYEEIVNERYEFFDKNKLNGSFIDYFRKHAAKKNLTSGWSATDGTARAEAKLGLCRVVTEEARRATAGIPCR